MTKRLFAIGGLVAALGATGICGVYAQGPGTPGPAAPGARRFAAPRERHPELRQALRALERAKMALQNAAHDFDGHREKALDLTQHAIEQVQQAMASDKH